MISRVADHCFWFGRYLDRAESTARLLETTRMMVLDSGIPVTQCWQPLVIVSGEYPRFRERYSEEAVGDGEVVQQYMTWDEQNLVSLRRSVAAARENARVVRDALSEDVWHEINGLFRWLEDGTAAKLYTEDREGFYRNLRRGTQLCLGLVRSTMLHDEPMSFLWLGVMLERVGQIARILDMHDHTMEREHAVGTEREKAATESIIEDALWLVLLRACSGSDAFRKTHQGRVTVNAMVSLLVYDERFPRSLMYCLKAARKISGDIWAGDSDQDGVESLTAGVRLDHLATWLREQRVRTGKTSIHELLTRVVDETTLVCRSIETEIREGRPVRGLESVGQSQRQ